MPHDSSLEDHLAAALAAFPYALAPTGITQGDLEPDPQGAPEGDVDYSAEYTFDVGTLLDQRLVAGGWIDLRREDDTVSISALFAVARDGDWQDKDAQVLPACTGILGAYDPETATWDLTIDRY